MRGEVDEMSNSTNGAVWPKMFAADYLHYQVKVKTEPVEEARTDSGIASSGDSVNTSPSSDRSDSQSEISHPGQYSSYGELFPADENSNEVEDIRNPKVNSHGRVRKHKCKQCGVCTYTKSDFWEHSKSHIKAEKMLKCDKCPFVTEYKHHLEYHMSNHLGAKPFKCDQCDYSCVNKSMLNSHLKSHSKVYQYRCQDCNYETKYVHSLKLHLRKYSHKPAMVLNPDGTPSAHPIIDVYGTRRGPKIKRPQSNPVSPTIGATSSPSIPQLSPQLPAMQGMFNPLPMPVTDDMIKLFHFMVARQALLAQSQIPQSSIVPQDVQQQTYQHQETQIKLEEHVQIEDKALDLTNKSGRSSDDDEQMTTVFDNVEVVTNSSEDDAKDRNEQKFTCLYCDISFGQEVLYSIHMGYHRYLDPFTCNRCGQKCGDKVTFFDHIHKAVH